MSVASVVAAIAVVSAVSLVRGGRPTHRLSLGRARPSPRLARALGLARRGAARVGRKGSAVAPIGAVVEAWSAQLRAGRPVGAALGDALDDVPRGAALLPHTVVAVSLAGDVESALRLDAARSGDHDVARVLTAAASCWTVADDNGGRLADALDRLGDGLRADAHHAAHVRAQLAGPRATARMLAALPALALLLGAGIGLDPLDFLLGTTVGRLVLLGGLLLDALGLWWTERMARAAVRAA